MIRKESRKRQRKLTSSVRTKQKETPEVMQKERLFASTLLDTVGALVVVLDTRGRIIRFNRTCEQVTGYTFEEVHGKLLWDLFLLPEEIEPVKAVFENLRAGNFPNSYENYWLTKNSDRRLISWSNTVTLADAGSVEYIIGTGIDITEHRHAQIALQESLKELEHIKFALDQSAIVAITDQEGIIHYVNDKFCEISKYSRQELIGQDHRLINSHFHSSEFMRSMWLTISSGHVWKGEIRNRAKDGSYYWVDTTIVPFLDFDGTPYQYVAIHADITARKRAEQRLAAEHAVARALAECATFEQAASRILQTLCENLGYNIGEIFLMDSKTNYLRCVEIWTSPAFEHSEFASVTPELTFPSGVGLPGRVWSSGKCVWIPNVAEDSSFLRLSIAQKEDLHGAFGFPILMGSEILGIIDVYTTEILYDDAQLPPMFTAIGAQIGQFIARKRMEETARASEANYREIFDSANDAIFVHDFTTGEILDVNRKTCEMYGYTRDEICCLNVAALSAGMPPYGKDAVVLSIRRTVEEGPQLFEWLAKDKGGRLFWVEVNLRLAMIGGKNRLLAVVRDITERKKLEEQLRERSQQVEIFEEKLRQAEKLMIMGMLASEIAHEVGTPLNIISGRVEILAEREKSNERIGKDLDVINQQIERISKIIRQHLDLTRRKGGLFGTVNIHTLLSSLLEFLRIQMEKANIEVDFSVDKNLEIQGDEDQLQQVFINVLMNAIEAMDEAGRLSIRSARRHKEGTNFLEIQIQDTGPGIHPDLLEKIFDPFFSTKKDQGGTGVGLSVVQDIIKRHGGEIFVDSEIDEGTTFYIWLPESRRR